MDDAASRAAALTWDLIRWFRLVFKTYIFNSSDVTADIAVISIQVLFASFKALGHSYGYCQCKIMTFTRQLLLLFPQDPIDHLFCNSVIFVVCLETAFVCFIFLLSQQTGQQFPTASVTYCAVPNDGPICLVSPLIGVRTNSKGNYVGFFFSSSVMWWT